MPLPDVNLYLDPWYFSYWTYLAPVGTTIAALFAIFFGISKLNEYRSSSNKKLTRSLMIYPAASFFILVGIAILIVLIPRDTYDAYRIKNSRFKTEPYITLTSTDFIHHDKNKKIPWQEIEAIRYLRGGKGRKGRYELQLKNDDAIRFERSFTQPMPEVADLMKQYLTHSRQAP
jgi:hypothetical protein